jgi:hypothetical protein
MNLKWLYFLVSLLAAVLTGNASALTSRAGVNPSVNPSSISLSPTGGGTYPRLANVQDGILAAYTAFNGGTHILTITRSTDGGKTFSAWGTVASGTGDIDNPDLVQLPNGDIVCTFRNHDKNSSGAYTWYRITATVSTDGGKTWTYLSQVQERAASGVNGLWASIYIAPF